MKRYSRLDHKSDIAPDEIFLDDKNIPDFDVHQFEGRIEEPIKRSTIIFLGLFFTLVSVLFLVRAGILEIREGETYAKTSEQNRLEHLRLLVGHRGIRGAVHLSM